MSSDPFTDRIVVITGLTGFIALHIAKHFLDLGCKVRGTVRSTAKGDAVLALPALKSYADSGRLSYAVIEDVATGDYTEIMRGADYVIHTASPVTFDNSISWEGYKRPALEGARAVHQSAVNAGAKHIIQLSSLASVSDWITPLEKQEGWVYDENSWNPVTEEQAVNLESFLPKDQLSRLGVIRYCAGKKFAELAVLDIQQQAKKEGKEYKLTILNPPTVLGPTLDDNTPIDKQGWSISLFPSLLAGRDKPVPGDALVNYVDVRDLIVSMSKVIAKGAEGRYVIRAGNYDMQLLADRIRELFPELEEQGRVVRGTPGLKGPRNTLDATKSIRELQMTYRPLDETVRDTVLKTLEVEAKFASK